MNPLILEDVVYMMKRTTRIPNKRHINIFIFKPIYDRNLFRDNKLTILPHVIAYLWNYRAHSWKFNKFVNKGQNDILYRHLLKKAKCFKTIIQDIRQAIIGML